jgi:hypothetical protein
MTRTVETEAYRAIGEAGARMLERFTREELEIILRFARRALELQNRFTTDGGAPTE